MPINLEWEVEPYIGEHVKNKEMFTNIPSDPKTLHDNLLQITPQGEKDFRELLHHSLSILEDKLRLREELTANLYDRIWEMDWRGFKDTIQTVRDVGFDTHWLTLNSETEFYEWSSRFHKSWLSKEGGVPVPFTILLNSEKLDNEEKRIETFLANEINKITKSLGYTLFAYPNLLYSTKGWKGYRLVLPRDLELTFRRIIEDFVMPIAWFPYTFPPRNNVWVKRVKGINPGPIPSNIYWLKNVDIYNSNVCDHVPRCRDCMAIDVLDEGELFMDEKMMRKLLDELEGIQSVHFAGPGEPFEDPNIFNDLNYASRKVTEEVRVNTNLSKMPRRKKQAEKFFMKLPKNIHIFASVDKYHEERDPYLREKALLLQVFSDKLHFPVTFNVRVMDKYSSEGEAYDNTLLSYYDIIENRVLKMGNAREMRNARKISLQKLLNNIADRPGVGVLTDGTVVTNFIVAYLPPDVRPSYGVLGNIKEESMLELMKKYEQLMYQLSTRINTALKLTTTEMKGRYPYVVKEYID